MRVSILYCGACLCPRVRGCSMCAWRAAAGRVLIFLTAHRSSRAMDTRTTQFLTAEFRHGPRPPRLDRPDIAHELHAREPMTHVPCDVPCDVLLTPLQARSSQPPPSSTVVIRDQSLKCHVLTYCSHLYRHSSQPPPSSTVVRRDQSLKCHDGESSRLSRYTRHQTSNREVNRPK